MRQSTPPRSPWLAAKTAALLSIAALLFACAPADREGDDLDGSGLQDEGLHGHARGKHKEACNDGTCAVSAIEHLVVVIQENHSFDAYFGRYCQAPTGSSPSCTEGPDCCEAGPAHDPSGAAPVALDDARNLAYDPRHNRACETAEIHGGAMDRFVTGAPDVDGAACGDPRNFAYATDAIMKPYHDLAAEYALADRYFQPIIGASSANDMYLAGATYAFDDNSYAPLAIGTSCSEEGEPLLAVGRASIGNVLASAGVDWRFYAEGYAEMAAAERQGTCPDIPSDCPLQTAAYPCLYDPEDDPFAFYPSLHDDPRYMADLDDLERDLSSGALPAVSFVKPIGYRTEHPGTTISAGTEIVTDIVSRVNASSSAASTLVLVMWDEAGGYFDHVAPPPASEQDGQPYGPRIPLLAIGPFARKGTISHVTMEHSSIVRFIEWNWLGEDTGQLAARDAVVNNIGSLLDPEKTLVSVPE
ncbi:MAG: alkaline phosphatase family protein [Polyangiaceae bacterium]